MTATTTTLMNDSNASGNGDNINNSKKFMN